MTDSGALTRSPKLAVVKSVHRLWFVRQPLAEGLVGSNRAVRRMRSCWTGLRAALGSRGTTGSRPIGPRPGTSCGFERHTCDLTRLGEVIAYGSINGADDLRRSDSSRRQRLRCETHLDRMPRLFGSVFHHDAPTASPAAGSWASTNSVTSVSGCSASLWSVSEVDEKGSRVVFHEERFCRSDFDLVDPPTGAVAPRRPN